MATPTIVGTPVYGEIASGALTLSVTVPAAGQNQGLFFVCGQAGSSAVPTSVTYNGGAMTQLLNLAAAQQLEGLLYFTANPTTGTHDIVMNFASNVNLFGTAFVLQDVVQASPIDGGSNVGYGQANTGSATSISKSITTATDGDFVIAWAMTSTATTSLTKGGSQTDITAGRTVLSGASDNKYGLSYQLQTTAGAINSSYSWTTNGSSDFFVAALKYVAPSGGGGTPNRGLNLLGVGQ